MPNIKQAQRPPANLKNMTPVSSSALSPKQVPPISAAINESNLSSTATGPIPAVLGTAYDSIKQWIRPGNAPQYRIFPLPLKANSQVGSIVNSIIESQPTTPVSTTGDMSWKGNWLSFQTYNIYDVVQFNISTYMALNTSTGVEPEGNPISWVLVSKNLNVRGQWTGGAPAFVQGVISGGAFLTNVPRTVAFPSDNAAGNTIVVFANAINTGFGAAPFTASDTQGNLYVAVQTVFYPVSGPFSTTTVLVATGVKPGPNTVSVSNSGPNSTQGSITIAEYGNIGITPLVVSSGIFTDTFSLPVSLTTSGTDLVALFYQGASSGSASPPGGFVLREGNATNIGGGITVFWDSPVTFTGTQSYTVSSPAATGANTGAVVGVVLSGFSGGYEPFDVVLFEGNTFICIADTVLDPFTDPGSWQLLASGGIVSIVDDVNVTATLTAGVLTLGWTGQLGLSRGGTNSDLSATGGTSQVLRQSSVGAAVTVSQLAASDLSNGTTGTGAVVLAISPALAGSPTAPTQSSSDNSTKIATTAFVDTALANYPLIVAKSSLTLQSAAIGATTIYAVPVSGAGMYRINWRASVTTVDASSSSLGGTNGFQGRYTDLNDSVVKTSNPTTPTVSAGNTTATTISGTVYANCKASTNLQYLFDYTSNTPGQMIYDLDVYVEFLS